MYVHFECQCDFDQQNIDQPWDLIAECYINCVIHELNDDKLDKRGKNPNSNSLLSSVDNFDQNRDLRNDRFKLISLNFFVSV